ncbi:MAG: hypothetical protein HZB43_11105 [candidate division Zixibacteria bacterium]|nr:hypothetical protein [candidate division Zixibacteria bacterium]
MLTVTVAARQPESQKRYRELLKQLGVAAHFVTDHEQLLKYVRTRPVDLVLFDLNDPRWPARKWLEAAAVDSDLAAVPVVWVGSEAPAPEMEAITRYRLGVHLPKMPDAAALTAVISTVTGAVRRETDSGQVPVAGSDPDSWKPAVHTIDDALSIFAEAPDALPVAGPDQPSTKTNEARRNVSGPTGEDYDLFVSEMVKTEPHSLPREAVPGFVDSGVPTGTEKGILIPHPDDADFIVPEESAPQTRPDVGLSLMIGLEAMDQTDCPVPERDQEADAQKDLIDKIAGEVAARLAGELVKKLDPSAIRKAVEATLTNTR